MTLSLVFMTLDNTDPFQSIPIHSDPSGLPSLPLTYRRLVPAAWVQCLLMPTFADIVVSKGGRRSCRLGGDRCWWKVSNQCFTWEMEMLVYVPFWEVKNSYGWFHLSGLACYLVCLECATFLTLMDSNKTLRRIWSLLPLLFSLGESCFSHLALEGM